MVREVMAADPGAPVPGAHVPHRGRRRLRRVGTRVLLVLGATVASLALVDLLLGAAEPACPRDLYVNDGHVGWRHRPGVERTFVDCSSPRSEFRTRVRFDANGFRGPGRDTARQPGTFRILLLGDSFTEALQVEEDETFAVLLEQQLGRREGAPRLEVWNGGVSGYGTDNELLAWRNGLSALAPDLVILVMSQNDVYENSRELIEAGPLAYPDKPYFVRRSGGAPELRNDPVVPFAPQDRTFVQWLGDWLVERPLYRLVTGSPRPPERRDVRMLGGNGRLGNLSFLEQYNVRPPKAWEKAKLLTADLVRTLVSEVQATGARMAIVVVPDKRAVRPELLDLQLQRYGAGGPAWNAARPYETVLGIACSAGVPCLGLLPPFVEHYRTTGDTGMLDVDIHFSRSGHEIAAREIERLLRDQRLLPEL